MKEAFDHWQRGAMLVAMVAIMVFMALVMTGLMTVIIMVAGELISGRQWDENLLLIWVTLSVIFGPVLVGVASKTMLKTDILRQNNASE